MVDWNTLLDEHGPLVVGISWRILGHAADAEDNVQEVFLEAYRLSGKQDVAHWRGLLRRLATYGALARLRRRKQHVPLAAVAEPAGGPTPEDSLLASELRERLRHLVAQLPHREAAVFSLRYFEGLSLQEIAESLSVKYSAAGAALSRARAKLERSLQDVVLDPL